MTWDYIAAPKKENLTKTFDVFSFFPNNSPFLNFPQKIFLLKIIHDGKILEQYQCLNEMLSLFITPFVPFVKQRNLHYKNK